MPEFEIRLFNAQGQLAQTITIDAASEKKAVAKAARVAKQNSATSFDVRRPLAQRWIKRS